MSDKEPAKIELKDSMLGRMLIQQEQKRGPSEQITPKARWAEDEYVKVRWYHIRWDWFRLWAIQYWEDRQPASGILCPLLGRHWYKDWRGFASVWDHWTIERFSKSLRCLHCGQHKIISSFINPGQEEKVYPIKDFPFHQIK